MKQNKDETSFKKSLTPKSKNISKWYNEVIQLAELADYGPAKGTMVIRPYGYGIWENIQKALDTEIKKSGAKNAYFPLFIPESLFEKEKEHVKGFSPELAVVTIGGGEELTEKLVVRPTSEMIMYKLYAKWIKSWRDLPLVINQWNNVVRWEKRTYLFLRTSEFLWQEGHGAHATHEDSWERVMWGIEAYKKINREFLAIPGIIGKKSPKEKFAGAVETLTYEVIIPGGKVLQGCTSHDLGQNFSRVQNICFQDKEGKLEFVWQNSWGYSTRVVGALVLVHGDDQGLVLPPKVAPIKSVIIPILGKKDEEIIKYCQKVKETIEEYKSDFPGEVEIWGDTEKSFGWKVNEAELKGIPVRITVGTRELYDRTVSLKKRIDSVKSILIRSGELPDKLEELLISIQAEMLNKAEDYKNNNSREVNNFSEFKELMKTKRGFIRAFWCEDEKCEESIKEETKASTRCLELDAKEEKGKCIYCKKQAIHKWIFALAY